jgi:methionine-S-sulfoxide reductase
MRLLSCLIVGAFLSVVPAFAQTSVSPAGPVAKAIFASGCFWCTESDFDKVPGVLKTLSGYVGGSTKNPTYEQIGRGDTGHAEAVEVTYDPSKVNYETLVEYFWRTTDVLDAGGQFCDRGSQYRPEIFVLDDQQKSIAEASKQKLAASKRFTQPIVVKVTSVPAQGFTVAEEYHQDYYKNNPIRYYTYRTGCGRDARLQAIWGKEAGGKSVLQPQASQ